MKEKVEILITYLPKVKELKLEKLFFGQKWFPENESKRFYIGAHYNYKSGNGTCILTYTVTDKSKKYKLISANKKKKTIRLEILKSKKQ